MDGTIVATVLLVLGAAVVVVCGYFVWWAHGYLLVLVTRGTNDDAAATTMFIGLVNEAKQDMIIHDDGDSTEASVYNNEQAVEAVRRRLQEHRDLEIKCFFNKEGETRMASLSKQFPGRFQVRYLQGERPGNDIHYKIIDGGCKAYLSVHDMGGCDREYEMIDCTDSPPRIRQRMFRKFYDQINRAYVSSPATQ